MVKLLRRKSKMTEPGTRSGGGAARDELVEAGAIARDVQVAVDVFDVEGGAEEVGVTDEEVW